MAGSRRTWELGTPAGHGGILPDMGAGNSRRTWRDPAGHGLGLSAAMKKIASFFAHFTCIFIFCCSYRHSPQRIRKSITTRIRGHLFRCTFQHRSNIIGPHIDWCLFPFCRALFKIAEAGFFLSLPICFVSCSIPDSIFSVSFYFQGKEKIPFPQFLSNS